MRTLDYCVAVKQKAKPSVSFYFQLKKGLTSDLIVSPRYLRHKTRPSLSRLIRFPRHGTPHVNFIRSVLPSPEAACSLTT